MRNASIPALVSALALAAAPARALDESDHASRCGTGVPPGEATGLVFLPTGEIFCQLVADPKAIRSFASYLRGKFPTSNGTISVGSIGVADEFAFFRVGGPGPGEGVQLGIQAAVFAQFDLDTPSRDLLNADYLVGLPLTFRREGFSARLRLYHQSSHLGDEFLLRPENTVKRLNLAFESVELMLSQEVGPLRVYAGGEYLFNRNPSTLDPKLVHGGVELRAGPQRGGRAVAALDVKSTEQQRWKPAWSARAGLEIAWSRDPASPPRLWSILAEYYDGPSPYGQFFLDHTRYYGVGLHFQL
jgi:Protein of unknown function (DUF1207)